MPSKVPVSEFQLNVIVVVLVSNSVEYSLTRQYESDVAGAALTGDPPVRHAMAGETITFAVSGSPTGLTWKAVLVVEPGSN